VRADGRKVLLAIRRRENTEAWRAMLDDLVRRGLRRPNFLIVDGAPGLDKAIAAVYCPRNGACAMLGNWGLKILAGIAIVLLSFAGTTFLLNWLWNTSEPSMSGQQPAAGKTIITSGDAIASTSVLRDDTRFQFKGNGLARIEGTAGLKCLARKCSILATVEFGASAPEKGDMIVSQSYIGEHGWHLLWLPGMLYLQMEGGGSNQIAAPFTPSPGQRYAIQIANEDQQVTMSIDGKIVGTTKQSPFTDIARDVTVGGRDGPSPNYFIGAVSNLRILSSLATN
jgi:Transposase, Mutator family